MKEQIIIKYEAPLVEVIEVQVERGFAGSVHVSYWNDGEHLGDYELE